MHVKTGREKDERSRRRLEEDSRDLLSNVLGRHFWDFGLLQWGDTSDEIHVFGFPDLRTLEKLPSEVEDDEEGDVDVGGEEVWGAEVPEDGEAVDEDEEGRPEDTPVRKPGLETAVVDELFAIETLCLEAGVCVEVLDTGIWKKKIKGRHTESRIGYTHSPPTEEATDGRQVDEPAVSK